MTPTRSAMTAISILAAVLIAVVSLLLYRKGPDTLEIFELEETIGVESRDSDHIQDRSDISGRTRPSQQLDWLSLVLLVAVGVCLLLFKTLKVDKNQTFLRQETVTPVDIQSDILAAELGLTGYNLSQDSVVGGESFEVDLAWRVLEPPQADYQSNIWLVGPGGLIWSDKETTRPRTYEDTAPSRFWLPGQWTWDSREIPVFDGTPPGVYDILLILFNRDTLAPLTLYGSDGAAIGPHTILGQIEVTLPDKPAVSDSQYEIEAEFDGLTLMGYNQDRQEASPGDPLLLTFFWQRHPDEPSLDGLFHLYLLDSEEEVKQQWWIRPVSADYPLEEWPEGQTIRDQQTILLDRVLESGAYTLVLEGTELGHLEVSELQRSFDEPPFDYPLHAKYGAQAELVGLTVEPANIEEEQSIVVSLVWRAMAEMPLSYHVFVHLVNEHGDIVVQSDGIPAGWTLPTTGWIPGEYIVDSHRLVPESLVDGERFEMRIGLYDPSSGIRLTTDGEEFVLFPLTGGGS